MVAFGYGDGDQERKDKDAAETTHAAFWLVEFEA